VEGGAERSSARFLARLRNFAQLERSTHSSTSLTTGSALHRLTQRYRTAAAGAPFADLRNHSAPPAITSKIDISCVPATAPPNTSPRPGSSRRNSKKYLAKP